MVAQVAGHDLRRKVAVPVIADLCWALRKSTVTETPDAKQEESDLASKRLDYAIQLFQNEVGRVWQRSLAFWGFFAAAFVAYGAFIDKHNLIALVIACFGLVSSVCWTLVNRASRRSQEFWVRKVDSLELDALGIKILKSTPNIERKTGLNRLWNGARYSTTQIMIALSDATAIVWVSLIYRSSISFFRGTPSEWSGAAIAVLLGTLLYVLAIALLTRSRSDERRQ
jgi:hypothetical protein